MSVVDPEWPVGYQNLALDSKGNPHIAYTGDANVSYAYQDGLEWRLTTVFDRAGWPDIALDASDTPHLCFYNANLAYPTGLYYATKTETGWAFDVVFESVSIGTPCDLVLDDQGWPHLVYGESQHGAIRYAYKDAGGWHIETIMTDGAHAHLALDSTGAPHVVIDTFQYNTPRVLYATRTGPGAWQTEWVTTTKGSFSSFALDSKDRPHVAYQTESETLGYSTLDESGWHETIVDTDRPTAVRPSITVDSQDRPHIAYGQLYDRGWTNDPARGHLKYATLLPEGSWETEFVDPTGLSYHSASIALDSYARPHIAYSFIEDQITNGLHATELRYAEPVIATVVGPVERAVDNALQG